MVTIGDVNLSDFPLILAPMEDVSDPPFRALCKDFGVDLVFTEFISSEGLIRYASKSLKKLDVFEKERPVGIQIFGANLDAMIQSVDIIEKVNPDIIDINYGCPVKKVVCKNAGAGILRDIPLMVQLTKEIVKRTKLPITVKTRLGWDASSIKIVEVSERLQDVGIKAISIHGRTREQMYKGSADWSWIRKVKENSRMHIPVFANGDITTPELVKSVRDDLGVDGAMIGRAAIGNPWFFREAKHFLKTGKKLPKASIEERVLSIRKHLESSISWKGERLAILEMRKHYGNYLKGLEDSKQYRTALVDAESIAKIQEALNTISSKA